MAAVMPIWIVLICLAVMLGLWGWTARRRRSGAAVAVFFMLVLAIFTIRTSRQARSGVPPFVSVVTDNTSATVAEDSPDPEDWSQALERNIETQVGQSLAKKPATVEMPPVPTVPPIPPIAAFAPLPTIPTNVPRSWLPDAFRGLNPEIHVDGDTVTIQVRVPPAAAAGHGHPAGVAQRIEINPQNAKQQLSELLTNLAKQRKSAADGELEQARVKLRELTTKQRARLLASAPLNCESQPDGSAQYTLEFDAEPVDRPTAPPQKSRATIAIPAALALTVLAALVLKNIARRNVTGHP